MSNMKYPGVVLCFFVVAFCSCQKVINVNLNSSSTRYVVNGNVTNLPGPYTVSITQTVDYDQDNSFPGVSGAIVCITDSNSAITDTLSEVSVGNYQTHTLSGVPGHTYKLQIIAGGNVFSASSTMPAPIAIDSMYIKSSISGRDQNVVPVYKDPVGTGNYYYLVLRVRDSVSQTIYTHSDALEDGNTVTSALRNDIEISAGDEVIVDLQCVDKPVYDYYRDLSQTIQQNSATPANPRSNVAGALGYFSAHAVSRKMIIAP